MLRSKTVYGDNPSVSAPADKNALGKPYQIYDEAGLTTMNQYDFKGNPMEKTREVISDATILEVFSGPPADWDVSCYRVNWDAAVALEGNYVTSMQYDALNRARSVTYPQDVNGERKILLPTYNKGGALTKVDLKDTALSSAVNYVERIAYNAKGQQLLVAYGNGIMTRFLYREDNFRLLRLKSEKYTKSGLTYTPNSGVKQNYSYEYDLSGNIINISDTTANCGYGATPNALSRDFIYDALYRLLSATGRETAATGTTPWDDLYRPQDESLARGYRQLYNYDKLGNIKELQHIATSGNFTRTFGYDPLLTNNALQKITIGSNEYDFSHDVNGNMLSEGDTARHLEYDCADRLRCFYVQTPLAEPSKYTHYLYDGTGNRVKKIIRKQGGGYTVTTYIDGAFEHTKESGVGEQNILNIMGSATRRIGADLGDSTPAIKYNLADQLGSSCVQLDTNGTIVSLEEYYPFGETSFGSYAKKRYRFCGKEKDEESGLYYYGMRYYSSWTCRFINVDPLAGKFPFYTPYQYAGNQPIISSDLDGLEPTVQNNGQTSGQEGGGSASDNGIPKPPPGLFAKEIEQMNKNQPAAENASTQNVNASTKFPSESTQNAAGANNPFAKSIEEVQNTTPPKANIYPTEPNVAAKIEKGIEILSDMDAPEAKAGAFVASGAYNTLDAIYVYSTKISGDIGITSEGTFHMNGSGTEGAEVQDAGISALTTVGTLGMASAESTVAKRLAKSNTTSNAAPEAKQIINEYVNLEIDGFYIRSSTNFAEGVYTKNVQTLASMGDETSILKLVSTFEKEALELGANKIIINGIDIVNTKLFNAQIAQRLGYTFEQTSNNSIKIIKNF